MKIVHHETVTGLAHDPNSSTGLKSVTTYRVSTVESIGFPNPANPDEPLSFVKGADGTFDVPEKVGEHFVKGSTGHGQKGWSVWTGTDGLLAEAPGTEVAELRGQVADLTAQLAKVLEQVTKPEATAATK